jgi:hypothetical protein
MLFRRVASSVTLNRKVLRGGLRIGREKKVIPGIDAGPSHSAKAASGGYGMPVTQDRFALQVRTILCWSRVVDEYEPRTNGLCETQVTKA